MTSKTNNIIKWMPSVLATLLITGSAFYKLSGAPALVEIFTELGLLQYINLLAGMELLFIILFLFPRTMKIGFLLLTAHFGGAMATEFVYGGAMMPPTIILTLLWTAAYLRKPTLFWGEPKQNSTAARVTA